MKATFAFLPLIRQGELKKVVAISSGMGDLGRNSFTFGYLTGTKQISDLINEVQLYNAAPYAISKAALNTLFAKFHASYADEGILFISLCPGMVNTAEEEVACKCFYAKTPRIDIELTRGASVGRGSCEIQSCQCEVREVRPRLPAAGSCRGGEELPRGH